MTEKRFELTMRGNEVAQYEIIDHSQEILTVYNDLGNVYFSSAMKICELLNNLADENEQLKQLINDKTCDNTRMKKVLNNIKMENYDLKEENKQLKSLLECSREEANDYCEELLGKDEFVRLYEKENEQLKQRNENQYKQLNQLWQLIEAKDWKTLTEMDNQMKEDEERLQKEWKCYE